jgi:type VI secretion system protein ImpA
MPLRDDLLNPIAGENPSGASLRYDPLFDKIKEARREDDDAPQGEWAHERKAADWKQVIKLAGEALATKSKDLQLAAWLTEATLRTE